MKTDISKFNISCKNLKLGSWSNTYQEFYDSLKALGFQEIHRHKFQSYYSY